MQQLLLDQRHLLDPQLDAEVAARHHDALGGAHDLIGVRGRLRLLDLGDDRDVAAAVAQALVHRVDVLAAAHEGEGQQVHAHVHAGVDQPQVLLAHRRQGGGDVGQVEALARGQRAADLHRGDHLPTAHLVDAQANCTIREIGDVARVHDLRQPGPGDLEPLRTALDRLGREDHGGAGAELGHTALHRADAQLGARYVLQNGHFAADPRGRLANHLDRDRVLVRGLVGEVQACDVHARADHPLERVGVAGGGADGGDDLGRAHGVVSVSSSWGSGQSPCEILDKSRRPRKRPLLANRLRPPRLTDAPMTS